MNDTLSMERIIDYYDQPQLFVARDSFNTLYLCLLYDDTSMPLYTAIRISDSRLQMFNKGQLDLRQMFLHPEVTNEYFNVTYHDETYHITSADFYILPEDRLPADGYVTTPQSVEKITLSVPATDTRLLLDIAKKFGWACAF